MPYVPIRLTDTETLWLDAIVEAKKSNRGEVFRELLHFAHAKLNKLPKPKSKDWASAGRIGRKAAK